MKHFCFLLNSLDTGGIEINLLRFIQFSGQQFNSTIIVKKGNSGSLHQKFLNLKVEIRFVKTGYFNLFGWLRTLKVFKNGQFDAICDFTANFSGIYMLLAKVAGVSVRVTYYGQSSNHFNPSLINLFYDKIVNRLVRRFSTHIVLNSVTAFKFFFNNEKFDDCKFRIINNGLDISAFIKESENSTSIRNELALPNNAIILCHIGRYDLKKNQRAVIQVAGLFRKNNVPVYTVFCGENTEQILNNLDPSLEKYVFALGLRKDIASILRQSNVFYFPSYTEGQPNALIEAMIMGIPFVSSNIESIKEMVPDAYHCQLVDPDDIFTAYDKIHQILFKESQVDFRDLASAAANKFNAHISFEEFRKIIYY